MKCVDCCGVGWFSSYSYGGYDRADGCYIEKCDTCNILKSDSEAHSLSEKLEKYNGQS